MDSITIGSRVTCHVLRGASGTVLRHHPTLPAWVVQFGRRGMVNVYETELRLAGRRG